MAVARHLKWPPFAILNFQIFGFLSRFSKWQPSAILDFYKLFEQTLGPIFARVQNLIKMAAVRYFVFVGQILGRPTKSIWWSLSLCKIWFESL